MNISLPQKRSTCRCLMKLVISSGVSSYPTLWPYPGILGRLSAPSRLVVPNSGYTVGSTRNLQGVLSRT